MYYFDNKYLKQYLETKQQLEVFVDKEWLSITDDSDIEDSKTGVGYNIYGKPHNFEYTSIESVKINNKILTIDRLNNFLDPESAADQSKDSKEKPETGVDPDADTKAKKESIELGDYIINNNPKSLYYGTGGGVTFINEGAIVYKTYIGWLINN